jgi:RNA polymerase sigma-70 factor (ECF subfamily)
MNESQPDPIRTDGPSLDDPALLARAAAGDSGAWRTIYTATHDRLFGLLLHHIGNRDEALDVLQDTYVSAVKGIGRYRGEGTLEAWLSGIALRRARDWKRRLLGRMKSTDSLETPADAGEVAEPDHELGRRLREALAGLPERQRAAVLLHEHLGYSFREVGSILGISEATARVHAFRGREALRDRLDPAPEAGIPVGLEEMES